MRTRTTSVLARPPLTYWRGIGFPGQYPAYENTYDIDPSYTVHLCQDYTNPGPPYNSGGPLYIKKETEEYDVINIPVTRATPWDVIQGQTCAIYYQNGLPSIPSESSFTANDLTVLGTRGWSTYKPLRSNMDLNQFLGELKDLKRLTIGTKKLIEQLLDRENLIRDLASGYLSWEFGLRPILSDIAAMQEAYEFTARRIDFILRNNGKEHKRGGTILEESDSQTNSVQLSGWYGGGLTGLMTDPYFFGDLTTIRSTLTTKRKAWFEGKFGFYIPVRHGPLWNFEMFLNQGLGFDLRVPSLINTFYALTPWSWLLDWFTTTGDIIENWAAINNDGIYSRYAFIMAEDSYNHSQANTFTVNGGGGTYTSTYNRNVTFKQRDYASPYGFGIDTSTLSGWQLSILAALGLSNNRVYQ